MKVIMQTLQLNPLGAGKTKLFIIIFNLIKVQKCEAQATNGYKRKGHSFRPARISSASSVHP